MPEKNARVVRRGCDIQLLWRGLREFFNAQTELQERLKLLNQPWLEDFTRWSGAEDRPRLHGLLPPPEGRARHSVTGGGWCPGADQTVNSRTATTTPPNEKPPPEHPARISPTSKLPGRR